MGVKYHCFCGKVADKKTEKLKADGKAIYFCKEHLNKR